MLQNATTAYGLPSGLFRHKFLRMNKLTDLQARFVEEYLVDFNATKAAERAGSEADNLGQAGYEFLKNPEIRKAIDAKREDYSRRIEVTTENVIEEIRRMAFYDPIDLAGMGIHGPSDIAALPENVRRAIVGWSWDKAGNFTLKLADKSKALDQLARYTGALKDNPIVVNIDTEARGARSAIEDRLARLEGRTLTSGNPTKRV